MFPTPGYKIRHLCAITLNYCTYTNHVGVSPRALCTVWWILAMGLADLLGIADLHCRKVESTKWLKHKLKSCRTGPNPAQISILVP